MTTGTIIDVSGLCKSFRIPHVRRDTVREHVMDLFGSRSFEQLCILDDVHFSVRQGETFGIMGRNGSGKSTLLKLIAGIYVPDRGRIVVRGGVTAILELGVGWNPELDAVDNIYLLGTAMGMSLRKIRADLDEILAFAELERFANLKLGHFSSGMASRLAYSVAFRAVQEVLILDEIFAVGDAAFRARCEERYKNLSAQGHTVIIVSHTPDIVEGFCDRAILIEKGRVHRSGSGREVADAYLNMLGFDTTTRATVNSGQVHQSGYREP
jgi:ABC-type polysaccharide/polyol phosphate transport system ATPase subunit